jgi:hypothetical protein
VSSTSTEGRIVYRRWRIGGIEYRSDLIARDYMRRWTLRTPWGALRLHHILRSDHDRHFHDHPMSFVSFVLRGGYVEHRPEHAPRHCRPGSVVARRAEDLHRLELLGRDAWTFVLAAPLRRKWGFLTEDGWIVAGMYDEWRRRREAAK